MTTFLRTADGRLINADAIEWIKNKRNEYGGEGVASIKGGEITPLLFGVSRNERALMPVVAASPGYFLLAYFDADEPFVRRLPIVAWRIDDDSAIPVGIDEDPAEVINCVGTGILNPDGVVVCPYARDFPDEATWRKEMETRGAEALRTKLAVAVP